MLYRMYHATVCTASNVKRLEIPRHELRKKAISGGNDRFDREILVSIPITLTTQFIKLKRRLDHLKTNLPDFARPHTFGLPFLLFTHPSSLNFLLFSRFTLFSSPTACILSFFHSLRKKVLG